MGVPGAWGGGAVGPRPTPRGQREGGVPSRFASERGRRSYSQTVKRSAEVNPMLFGGGKPESRDQYCTNTTVPGTSALACSRAGETWNEKVPVQSPGG